MTDAWFVIVVVVSIVMFAGFVLAIAVMRAAWAQRERESLTGSDLRAVEESALTLIEQLKTEADGSLSQLGARCTELRQLITEADARIRTLQAFANAQTLPNPPAVQPRTVETDRRPSFDQDRVLSLASRGLNSIDIARATGLDCADVKAALKLRGKLPS